MPDGKFKLDDLRSLEMFSDEVVLPAPKEPPALLIAKDSVAEVGVISERIPNN